METDLKSSSIKFKSQAAQVKSRRLLPDIRNNTSFMTDSGEKRCERKTKRIAACDYESWDKYDPGMIIKNGYYNANISLDESE